MKARDLAKELEDALLVGVESMIKARGRHTGDPKGAWLTHSDVRDLMRERANNLASGLAQRTLSEELRNDLEVHVITGTDGVPQEQVRRILKEIEG